MNNGTRKDSLGEPLNTIKYLPEATGTEDDAEIDTRDRCAVTTAVETRAARFATVPEQELQYGYQEFLAVCYEMRKTTISPVCAPSLRNVAR